MTDSLLRYWRTARYLKPVQLAYRLRQPFFRPKPHRGPALRLRPGGGGAWAEPLAKPTSWLGDATFRFLDRTRQISAAADWNAADCARLWLYNLHYFDCLCQTAPPGQELLERWMSENPPGEGTGWEPYPTSLRIVNWIKWHLAGNRLSPKAQQSLANQVRWLTRNLEYHLLGNHLLANAKALVFSGAFFEGEEAERWLERGLDLLSRQIEEQVLADGGHIERSPMYHAIVLEDVLDLANILRFYGLAVPCPLRTKTVAMFDWLRAILHQDGQLPFFNDSTLGIAPSRAELDRYGSRLDFTPGGSPMTGPMLLAESGFARVEVGDWLLLADVGSVGPSYQPGHAHAETLSFELSVAGQRCLVNSGISCYGGGQERLRQRGAAAHNCLVLDGRDSSEVWQSHRVGWRARVVERSVDREVNRVVAAHDGYERLKGVGLHRRAWTLGPGVLEIADEVAGASEHEVAIFLHLHPAWRVEHRAGAFLVSRGASLLSIEGDPRLSWAIEESSYHPGFGISEPSRRIVGRGRLRMPVSFRTTVSLMGRAS